MAVIETACQINAYRTVLIPVAAIRLEINGKKSKGIKAGFMSWKMSCQTCGLDEMVTGETLDKTGLDVKEKFGRSLPLSCSNRLARIQP